MDSSRLDTFIQNWLKDTPCFIWQCFLNPFWKSPCERFIIMKHAGHRTWVDQRVTRCPTYYKLYDLETNGDPFVQKWEGRWNKYKQEEAEEVIACIRGGF